MLQSNNPRISECKLKPYAVEAFYQIYKKKPTILYTNTDNIGNQQQSSKNNGVTTPSKSENVLSCHSTVLSQHAV